LKKLPILILLSLSFGSCGVWENFTTYFNLYYNTKDIFDQVEEVIYKEKKPLFSKDELVIPGNINQQLTKVIEKTSVILQFHSESGYVDDALLMLGKSFFYQNNYQKALRKFQELIATQPESDLIIETRLWIGKTQMKLRDYENALATLKSLRTEEKEAEEEIIRDSYAEEIKFRILREEYLPAVELLKEFLNRTENDEVIAEIYFELGNLYASLNQMNDAVASYEAVYNYSPPYEVEFQTRVELGKALRETGRVQEALEIFESMGTENKYSESFDVIDVEIGITLKELRNYDEALNVLKRVDTTYAAKPSAGIARYHLGEIFELVYKNFDSAAVYYQKAVSSASPKEYLLKANNKAQLFKKYTQINSSINENQKKLLYLTEPEEFVRDSIAYFSALNDSSNDSSETDQEENQSDSQRNRRENTRRGTRRGVQDNQTITQQVLQTQKSMPPQRPTISADSIESNLLKNKYELGNLFFTEFNLPDSAYAYYQSILIDYPNSPYQARILYALGSYYEIINQPQRADSLYNIIYENYKNERIVNAAANKLNKPLTDFEFDLAKDLYSEAEQYMLKEDYQTSLKKFLDISNRFPKSPFAAKALYAGGWIMENKLNMYDSAAAVYDSITVKYPQTMYASEVKPKLNFYKQEQLRIKKTIEDSLRNEQIRLDSLASADSLKLIKESTVDSLNQNKETVSGNTPENESTGRIPGPAALDSLQRKEKTRESHDSNDLQKTTGGNDSLLNKGRKQLIK
jgi:tetratricopeptide (TPR) repeat protein